MPILGQGACVKEIEKRLFHRPLPEATAIMFFLGESPPVKSVAVELCAILSVAIIVILSFCGVKVIGGEGYKSPSGLPDHSGRKDQICAVINQDHPPRSALSLSAKASPPCWAAAKTKATRHIQTGSHAANTQCRKCRPFPCFIGITGCGNDRNRLDRRPPQ